LREERLKEAALQREVNDRAIYEALKKRFEP
jgi:hypothetical protein